MELKKFVNKYFSQDVVAVPLLTASFTLLLEYLLLVFTPSQVWMLPATVVLIAAVFYVNLHWKSFEKKAEDAAESASQT